MQDTEFIVLGSTGMLGQALMKEIGTRNISVIGVARDKSDICIDITDDKNLIKTLSTLNPKVIINTVAIVNLSHCESNPAESYMVNARVSAILSRYCSHHGIRYVYISTDHYYTGDGDRKHSEQCAVNLCNEYATSKYLGEILSLQNDDALIVRTNIVGFRYKKDAPTFIEWAIKSLKQKERINLFNNYYTSSIDVCSFSRHLLDLILKDINGVFNLASSEVSNKQQFIDALAMRLSLSTENTTICPMNTGNNDIRRNESLGLDVQKVEKILNCSMPTMSDVVNNLANEYSKR